MPLEPAAHTTPTFREARDLLLELREDYFAAKSAFVWPRPDRFNWALDWFDAELAAGDHGRHVALKVLGERVEERTFAELSQQSSRLANGLRSIGAKRGDRILMMLGNMPELWVTMLAAMKLGLVLIPAMPQLGPADIADRLDRGKARFIVTSGAEAAKFEGLAAGAETDRDWRRARGLARLRIRFLLPTRASSRTDRPQPTIRCCSTSLRARRRGRSWCCTAMRATRSATCPRCTVSVSSPGTSISTSPRRAGRSTPGRAFLRRGTPGATIVALAGRFEPRQTLDILIEHGVTVFCAPPTVWRMLIQEDLPKWEVKLREVNSARRAAQSRK